jgi:diacylglycerol kinase family enzyme
MVVVGVSGERTYGGHMPVLPGQDNICLVGSMKIMEKIRNKKLFYQGRHGELPQVRFMRGRAVDVSYNGVIPMQLDGELTWLTPASFPLTMTVMEPTINILGH